MVEFAVLLIGFFVFLEVYFIPSFVALGANHNNKPSIIFLNTLLGWTVLGWIAAFVWSLAETNSPRWREVNKMPKYEVPQEFESEEKVIGGMLSLRQFVYLVIIAALDLGAILFVLFNPFAISFLC